MSVLIQPQREGSFKRRTGHSIKLGMVVAYELVGARPFSIIAHREGVEMSGSFPVVQHEGVTALKNILDRAVRHHQHLKSFPLGVRQTIQDDIDYTPLAEIEAKVVG